MNYQNDAILQPWQSVLFFSCMYMRQSFLLFSLNSANDKELFDRSQKKLI